MKWRDWKNEKDYLLSKEDILKKYEIKDLEKGLTEQVAMKRLLQYGQN